MKTLLSLFTIAALAACGGTTAGVSGSDPLDPGGGGGGSGTTPGATPGSTPGATPPVGGHTVTIQMRGSTAPFAHADGFAGETPTKELIAVKSLRLLRTVDDPAPVVVFDLGASPVEADLLSGATTTLAKVPIAGLPAGVFTRAKVGVSYVRYSVDAQLHAQGTAVAGRYDNEQVLSDGAVIDGQTRKKGWFRYSFAIGTNTYGTLEGDDAPTPVATTAGGIGMDMSGPETFYAFPVQLAIEPAQPIDWVALFEVNVTDNFRWQDQPQPGYQTGVFDTTPSTFEPVMAFGANSFALSFSGSN